MTVKSNNIDDIIADIDQALAGATTQPMTKAA